MAAHSTKILPSLQEDTLQAQAVIPSFTSNGKFYYSLRDIFSSHKSGKLEQKIIL